MAVETREYRRRIDLLRFLAALGIVADHAMGRDFWFLGYPSLALFLILIAYFGVGSWRRHGGGRFWSSRAARLLKPWLFWCLFYRLVLEWRRDGPFELLSDPWSLLVGPSIHLWFLPFAALALVFVPPIARDMDSRAGLVRASLAVAVLWILLGLVHARAGPAGWLEGGAALPPPLPQWAFALPIYLWGAVAAVGHRLGAAWIPLAAAAAGSAVMTALNPDQASWQLILAALIFEGVWRWPGGGEWMTRAAGYAFGLYLMHPFWVLVGYKVMGPGMAPWAGFLWGVLGSLAGTWLFKRLPVLRGML